MAREADFLHDENGTLKMYSRHSGFPLKSEASFSEKKHTRDGKSNQPVFLKTSCKATLYIVSFVGLRDRKVSSDRLTGSLPALHVCDGQIGC